MPKSKKSEPKEPFRSFTVRIPQSFYIEISELSRREGLFVNQKINQLLHLGMGEHTQLDTMLSRLIKTSIANPEPTPND